MTSVVVDTSALAAVVFGEPEEPAFSAALVEHAGEVKISAPTMVEAVMVLEGRQGIDAVRDLELLVTRVGAEVVAFDAVQADIASRGWRRFGKGRHAAGLNLGDCFSYALAKHLGVPLLFKGGDFAQTDVASAL